MAFPRPNLSVRALALLGMFSLGALSSAAADRVFTVLAAGPGDWTDFGVVDGVKFIPVEPGRRARSAEQRLVSGSAEVVFARRVANPETGLIENQVVSRVAWPAGAERALFVLAPRTTPEGQGIVEALACDDGLEKFPPQSLRVVNATRAVFQGLVGRGQMQIGTGVTAPVKTDDFIPAHEEAPDPGMPLRLALATDKGVKTLYAVNLSVSPNDRVLLVVAPPAKAGSMRLKVSVVHDVVAPVEK
ncbi:MAG: hypothetical protein ABII82_14885 [Verrucomicrobiota bacterium]